MKKRAPRTIEEMFEAPEGQWNLLRGGFELEVAEDLAETDAKQIVVALPKRAFRARGKRVVERPAPKRRSRRVE